MTKIFLILASFFFAFSLTYAENDSSSYIQLIKSKKKKKRKQNQQKPASSQPSAPQINIPPPPSQANLSEPYRSVQLLPYNLEGWYSNARQIEQLFKKNRIKIAVEVGCWAGLSTTSIANLLPSNGRLYAVDHWKGSVEHQFLPNISTIYEQFLSNVVWAGLTDKIIPMRMNSLEAAPKIHAMEIVPDFIYINASHDMASVLADLHAWFPLVRGHGIICGDDWTWNGVRSAVEMFAGQNNLIITTSGNFWRLVEQQ